MSGASKKNFLRNVNPHLICPLCRGYLIDATTVVECLHSFCRTCILKYLKSESRCPSCKDALNKAKPNIKADNTLQDIVYKLVPGLYHKEMKRRKEFYMKHPEHADSATPEQRGEDASSRLFFAPEDAISLSLEYLPSGVDPVYVVNAGENEAALTNANYPKSDLDGGPNRRYLQCPALVTIAHLKKFLGNKYNIDVTRFNIEICQKRAALPDYMTLMDVAYIYAWKRNAPMRFFYIITQHEQFLEAPPNDRPSTPGLGASFPPTDEAKQEKKQVQEPIEKNVTKKPNKEETITVKSRQETESKSIAKVKDSEKPKKIAPKPEALKRNLEASVANEKKTVKTPIKILKTSNGSYQVQKSTKTSPSVQQASNPEFSVVSVDDGKIKLKQCSPSVSSKPKVISNVVFRTPDRMEKSPNVKEEKQEKKKMDKTKRKVTFVEESVAPEIKKVKDQPDKNQFLQSFELKSKDAKVEVRTQDSPKVKEVKPEMKLAESPKMNEVKVEMKPCNSPKAKVIEEQAKGANSPSVKVKLEDKPNSKESPKKPVATANSANIDVYAFPNEPPPQIIPGAIKRKCPPGLMITDVPASKRVALPSANMKKPVTSLVNTAKSYRKLMNKPANPTPPPSPQDPAKSPMTSSETRSLLDECGLNIPAGLSITLTSPRHSSNFPCFEDGLSDKVSPNISLNNKSLDPQVLKAFKMGQVVSNARQKKEQDILDLTKAPRIKIPKPPKKASPGTRAKQPNFDSQVVTLMGGQKYYRAPPGSLTPAAHRVSEFLMPPSRPPVYAPSCLGSPSPNFPKFESLYVLNQSPTLHQFQMDKFKMMQDNPKSHLVAQCPPTKPARSTQASLAIPVPKQSTNGMLSPFKKFPTQKQSRMAKSPSVVHAKPVFPAMSSNSGSSNASPSSDQNSPRVSSTASPSPPPTSSGVSEVKKSDCKKTAEVIKSPESPDSSSTIPEKEASEKSGNLEACLEKNAEKDKTEEKNTIFQERLLAAFPSREWDKNPKAAEHFGNLIKSLSDKESEEKLGAEKNVVAPSATQVVE